MTGILMIDLPANDPEVSVVVPTRGRAALACEAVLSAARQTVRDIEIIVVVDGPDEATVLQIKSISDDRIRVVVHDRQLGAACARDTGVGLSRGRWVAFLDDDDQWHDNKIEEQMKAVSSEKSIVTSLSYVGNLGNFKVKPIELYNNEIRIDEWLFDRLTWTQSAGFIQCSSLMFPKNIFQKISFAEMGYHDDWELVIRCVQIEGYRLDTAAIPLVTHLFDDARISLQSSLTWRKSLDWANSVSNIISARAYSGFLLSVAARSARISGDFLAFPVLLRAAFSGGNPTLRQIFAFILIVSTPSSIRRRVRAILNSRK